MHPIPGIFGDEYISEKLETKAGWNFASPDEDWMRGYPQELEDFIDSLLQGKEPLSGLDLAEDTLKVVYSGYLSAEKGQRVQLGPESPSLVHEGLGEIFRNDTFSIIEPE